MTEMEHEAYSKYSDILVLQLYSTHG